MCDNYARSSLTFKTKIINKLHEHSILNKKISQNIRKKRRENPN
jgi:hypothetical protein